MSVVLCEGDDSLPNRQMSMGSCGGNHIVFVSCASVVVGDDCFYFGSRFEIEKLWYEFGFPISTVFNSDLYAS
jgi:serine phosphatase RsbU (regulator of sigma subunit)